MNSYEELKVLKAKLVEYKNHLGNYGEKIAPIKVIASIDQILREVA